MPTVETLTINSISFPLAGAWEILDLTPLLQEGEPRGTNVTIPGVSGDEFRPKVLDTLVVLVPFLLYGDVNNLSSPHPDVRTGLKENTLYLNANLLEQNVGSVTATVTYPNASTLSGTVAVQRINVQNLNRVARVLRGVMRIELLDGKLT